ncbi:hypothetical protein [Nocardia australiensis]|uniref:hypothetical protein n=1 Tax=Nocardia australiensis TaxID=2887191 RepID=UPI001D139C64|nr:hypothetical protein [Nocardia australiensis]
MTWVSHDPVGSSAPPASPLVLDFGRTDGADALPAAQPQLAVQPLHKAVPLLEPGHLIQAISGRSTDRTPLVGWARTLGDLHAELIPFKLDPELSPRSNPCEHVHAGIDEVITQINAWAVRHIPRTKSARKHTHSLGEVISRIAMTYAEAWWTVLHAKEEEKRHQAWFHLSEAREGYAEMVDQIRNRHLQLPLGWRGIG